MNTELSNSKIDTAFEFINILENTDINYDANNWEQSTQKIAANRKKVEDSFIINLNENLLSIINESDTNGENSKLFGLVKLRALLNQMLGENDTSIDGVIIDEEYNFKSLLDGQLNYFKDLYKAIPEDEREEDFKEIIYAHDLEKIKNQYLNKKSRIRDLQNEILDLDRGYLFDKSKVVIENDNIIKDGFFSIGGEKVNVHGCIEQDNDHNEKFIPDIKDFPNSIDLRRHMSPEIEHQGIVGSCVANAITSSIEYISNRSTGKFFPMSRMFLYYTARSNKQPDIHAEVGDTGCNIIQALLSAKKTGICLDKTWPYDIEKVNIRPTDYAYVEAEKWNVDEFYQMNCSLDDMMSCLSEGYPFIFGLRIKDSFGKSGGIISEPEKGELRSDNHVNHAMLCVGYDNSKKVFIVRNSWGKNWGDNGYCYIPFSYMTNSEMIFDIVTIRKVDEKLNQEIRKNIWGEELGYFDDGAHNKHKIELIRSRLEKEKILCDELVNKHQVAEKISDKQDSSFKSIEFRNNIRQKLLDRNFNNTDEIKDIIRNNEINLNVLKNNLKELKIKENIFLYKWIGIPIILFVIIFIVSYFTNSLGNLSKFMITDFLSIFKGTGWKLINLFNSLTWCLLFYWTIYCGYKYYKNFFLVRKKYNLNIENLLMKDKGDKGTILNLYNEKWMLRFDYLVNTELLEEVLNSSRTFLHDKLKGVTNFIESIKQLRERISGSYKEAVIIDTEFSQNIFEIPDQNNIKKYYDNSDKTNSINLSIDGFQNNNNNNFDYLEQYIGGNNLFENEVNSFWKERNNRYLSHYTLSELLNNNYFDINDKVDGWNKFLKTYSLPLLQVDDQNLSLSVEETIEVSFNDSSFESFTDDLKQSDTNVSITRHTNDNEITVFRFVNTFSASQIKCYRNFHQKKNIKDYFLFDDVPNLKPNNN